ncbi:hypothetical protein HU200_038915 [Digitaria exilis]|uniref:Reverse transcriptase zinc-binding domain-containing protein n=1 Tax=Digitaria exilis TaxID=1010633 RepID=A0A835BN95_9POAL|nr:hypothetical protein HU200_038915 [Digitaria exilis]
MFQNSMDIQLGDGALALFWTDRWHGASSPCIAATDLCKLIKLATAKTRTVAQALANRTWISDIKGRLTIPALEQFIYLWHATNQCHLSPGMEDTFRWRWTSSGTYSARSAYRQFFVGATRMAAAQPLWKAWAPLKVKFTIWLAVHERLWTTDRRHRHGLQDSSACAFCDQERETSDHLFHSCYFTRQIWHVLSRLLNIPELAVQHRTMLDWWLAVRQRRSKITRKGLDSLEMLVSWRLWKIGNDIVFNSTRATTAEAIELLMEDANNWVQAGASNLATLGWPGPAAIA